MARLGRRERAALRERDRLEAATRVGVADRIGALNDLTPIRSCLADMWPTGKASVKWGYTGTIAGRIHRTKDRL